MRDVVRAQAAPAPERDGWRVRIQDVSGATHGAGMLLTGYQVLTCAHVVATALGAEVGDKPPDGELRIDFTAYGLSRGRWRAWVGPGGWLPSWAGDLAVLELAGLPPPGIMPAELAPCGPNNRRVRLYQFGPGGSEAELEARLTREPGPAGDWIRLESPQFAQFRLRYDGAGVADAVTGQVVGCLIDAAPAGPLPPRMIEIEEADRLLRAAGVGPLPIQRARKAVPAMLAPVPPPRLVSAVWWRDRQNLVTQLLRAFANLERGDLDSLFGELRRSFGAPFSMAAAPARGGQGDISYFLSLVNACVEQPGATAKLLAELQKLRPGAELAELVKLQALIDPEPELSLEQRRGLYDIIDTLSFKTAIAAYDAAGYALPPYAGDPITMARELETQNRADGLPAVVRFAEELAKLIPQHASGLRAWTNHFTAHDPALMTSVLRYRRSEPELQGRPVLMLRLQPDNSKKGYYKSVAQLHHSDALRPGPPTGKVRRGISIHAPDAVYDTEELFSLIDSLLSYIRQPPSEGRAVVEFAVPRPMLNTDFDQWPVGGVLPRPLGADRPVIVRMLGRPDDGHTHRAKWNWLLSQGRGGHPRAAQWQWEASDRPRELARNWRGDNIPVCIALGFILPVQDPRDMDEIAVAMHCGMPMMLLSRALRPRSSYQELEAMLARRGLLQFPDEIWRWRADGPQAAGLSQHVTLIFDDPAGRDSDATQA